MYFNRETPFFLVGTFTLLFCISIPGTSIGQFVDKSRKIITQNELGIDSLNIADEDRKDSMVATKRALLNTFVPIGAGVLLARGFDQNLVETAGVLLIGYGLIYGPSQGNLYAEDSARGMVGIGIRAGSIAVATFVSLSTPAAFVGDVAEGEINEKKYNSASAAILVSGLAFTGSMVYNLLTADKSAREYNKQHSGDVEVTLKTENLRYTQKAAPALTVKWHF